MYEHKYLRRISNDTYDTSNRTGFNIVQEDWVAGSVTAIREYVEAIRKEVGKQHVHTPYIEEKLRKIGNECEMIEFRVDLILRPPKHIIDAEIREHNENCRQFE